MAKAKLLIVDDNKNVRSTLSRVLDADFEVFTASEMKTARKMMYKEPDLVLLDIHLNQNDLTNREGVSLLQEFHSAHPELPIVMISAYGDVSTAVECMRKGALDFVVKPPNIDELRHRLKRALEYAKTSRKAARLEERLQQLDPTDLIGDSPSMNKVKRMVETIAQDQHATVLIQGETGTGKELVARAIHKLGPRSKEPWVAVAIATLNPNLVESELFGHVVGAFAGAQKSRVGFIEKAKGGVLFLDEIGELSLDMQVKLLRFLEERKFFPVGSSNSMEVEVQIVTATNRNLEEAVENGTFREDLYYRLRVVPLLLPPLRERTGDVKLLAHHFLQLLHKQGRTKITEISEEGQKALADYHWPGNVRQLKNEIERSVLQANLQSHQRIEREDLSPEVLQQAKESKKQNYQVDMAERDFNLDEELARWELTYIEEALQLTGGRKTEAWKVLGLNDRYALGRRVKSLYKKFPDVFSQFPFLEELYSKNVK